MAFCIIRSLHHFPHRIFADAQPLSGVLDRPGLDVDVLPPLLEGRGSWLVRSVSPACLSLGHGGAVEAKAQG